MSDYKVGDVVKATITGIENYGIFVSLDNYYSGLIHISEMSKDFVKSVEDYGEVGESIFVEILEIDNVSNHMKLSIKNIKYRIKNKKNRTLIKETGSGFLVLKNNLETWIDEKLKEIS